MGDIELVSPFTDPGYRHQMCPHDFIFADSCPTCLRRMYSELWKTQASAAAATAVVVHLARLIQTNPDVRYYVGGRGSQMRELLLAAIGSSGVTGDDPSALLEPAPHRRNDTTERERLMARIDELERHGEVRRG